MAATTISRATWTDDDGSGTTGTIINNARLAADVYDKIDALFASGTTLTHGGNLILEGSRVFYINETVDNNVTAGIVINQGASDDRILTFKSSDIAHGITNMVETDTYGAFGKRDGAEGGLWIMGFGEGTRAGVNIDGHVGTADIGRTTAAGAAIIMDGYLASGANRTVLGTNGNVMVVRNGGSTRFIFDAEGDAHADVSWTTFDSHDDALVLEALTAEVARPDDPYRDAIRQHFGESLEAMIPREELTRMKLVTFNDDGHNFVNMTRLSMLLTGAARQAARRNTALEMELSEVRDELYQVRLEQREIARQLISATSTLALRPEVH